MQVVDLDLDARRIRKYDVPRYRADATPEVPMPAGAEIVHANVEAGGVVVWAVVDDADDDLRPRPLAFFATDESIPAGWAYRGTAPTADADHVWHVFERLS